MRVYISGAITGNENAEKQFDTAEKWLERKKHEAINPYKFNTRLPAMKHEEYMKICFAMIDVCDCVYLLKGWQNSVGAKAELSYAKATGKVVKFEEKQWSFKKSIATEE